ncbi:GNAT family N-acetyltransferase [Sphingosinicella sp. BN140058]|uniref:GNAT family N-acetyltransferase n=1 Tax=Sphingosinicella sp. BN140058 TaxID=1892855 RepID=UPI0010136E02|nr:GNAT family protein [Sphingosinicella sp. BN140058]QAY75906.1 N-acetyltransferase [Sphingosinicella sp. BN140058]
MIGRRSPGTIHTGRFTLRPLADKELPALRRWLADERVAGGLAQSARDVGERGARAFLAGFDNRESFALAIVRNEDGAALGFYTLKVDWRHLTLTITLVVGEAEALEQAVAAETARAIVDWAFSSGGLEKVIALVAETNTVVAGWLGTRMQLEGRLRDEIRAEATGRRVTLLRFGLLKSDWAKVRARSVHRQAERGFPLADAPQRGGS